MEQQYRDGPAKQAPRTYDSPDLRCRGAVRIRPATPDAAQPVHCNLPQLRIGAKAAMLAGTRADVELMIVCQSRSVGPASRQHLVRNLGLLGREKIVLTFGDEDRHVQFRDERLVHCDLAETGEPVEW